MKTIMQNILKKQNVSRAFKKTEAYLEPKQATTMELFRE